MSFNTTITVTTTTAPVSRHTMTILIHVTSANCTPSALPQMQSQIPMEIEESPQTRPTCKYDPLI